jgi:hypothetical protein
MIHGNLLIEQGFLEEEEMEFKFCFFCTVSSEIIALNGINNWEAKEDFIKDYNAEKNDKKKRRDLDCFLLIINGLLNDFEKIKIFKNKKINK